MEINEIIKKAQEGNQIAYSQLLDYYWSKVYRFLASKTYNESDTEDLTIQTFSKAFSSIQSYDSQYNFGSWLMTIAKNLHIDFLRSSNKIILQNHKKENKEAEKILDETPTAEDQIIMEQKLATLRDDLKRLKTGYREILQYRYFNEMTYAEISEKTGEPLNNVKVKLLRAKKLLAQFIQNRKG